MGMQIVLADKDAAASFLSDERIFLGEGLFETLRITQAQPCYPYLHWLRLQSTAQLLSIPFDLSYTDWLATLQSCINLKSLDEGGIKVILAAGAAARGLEAKTQESQLLVRAFEYSLNSKPLRLQSATWSRDSKNPIYQIKSVNYLEAIFARRQAYLTGADEVLFFNEQGRATDTTIANLFLIKNNQLFTPAIHSGVLAGIIRQRLLILAPEQGINCYEAEIDKETLKQADALFVCNALQGIQAVSSFDNQTFNFAHPLLGILRALLERDKSI